MSEPEYGPGRWAPLLFPPRTRNWPTPPCACLQLNGWRLSPRPAAAENACFKAGAGGIAVTAPDPEWEAYMAGQAEAQADVFEPSPGSWNKTRCWPMRS